VFLRSDAALEIVNEVVGVTLPLLLLRGHGLYVVQLTTTVPPARSRYAPFGRPPAALGELLRDKPDPTKSARRRR
jgi:hypothetical protein